MVFFQVSLSVYFLHLFQKRSFGISFSRTRCPSCHLTNSVESLKETQSTGHNQWPGTILSASTTVLLGPFIRHFDASTEDNEIGFCF